jgi:cytidine deaminase
MYMPERNMNQEVQELISRLPLTDSPRFHPSMRHANERMRAILSLTPGNLLFTMQKARDAFPLAKSYRDFKVGAAVVGIEPAYQFLTGVNLKPEEDSVVNIHAEQLAMQKARDRGYSAIRTIVVVGNTQTDTQSGHEMHTLHPCGLCRDVMEHDPMVDNEVTLIASTTPDFLTLELYNLHGLKAFHETGSEEGIARFTFEDLPHLFDPIPKLKPGEAFDLGVFETPEAREQERVWDAKVGAFLLQRRSQLLREL